VDGTESLAWQNVGQNRGCGRAGGYLGVSGRATWCPYRVPRSLEARIQRQTTRRDLGVDHAAYLALLALSASARTEGRVGSASNDSAPRAGRFAYITEAYRAVNPVQFAPAEVERYWNEVARLRKELEMVSNPRPILFARPGETPPGAAPILLNADLDFRSCDPLEARPGRARGIASVGFLGSQLPEQQFPLMTSVSSANRPMLRRNLGTEWRHEHYAGVMGLFERIRRPPTVPRHGDAADALRFVVMRVDLLLSLAERAVAHSELRHRQPLKDSETDATLSPSRCIDGANSLLFLLLYRRSLIVERRF